MNNLYKRPMFRKGGSAEGGITSGLQSPRQGYALPGSVQQNDTSRQRIIDAMGMAPPKRNFNDFLINFGLDLVSRPKSGNIFSQVASSAREPFAQFQANFDSQPQTTQGLSRTRELNSFSHFTAPETAYLNTWRRKCERIGRNNYPAGLLEGELTMLVSILRDGSLANVKILRSSGQPKLDAAALATVRQAAPFQPFTVEMRKNYDRLDFTRTWQFSKQGSSLDF